MQKKVIEFNKETRAKQVPDFNAGDVVKVHRKIKEGDKERIQIFEGLIIAVKGGQSSSPTITVRKVSNGVGVEIIVPVFSPNIEKIEMVKKAKVRRAKLYYLRGLTAKKSRMKYKNVPVIVPGENEAVAEAVVEEKKEETPEEAVVEKK
ncbi:MAG: 50S ribosomal protein L19 [uncultured bacterium]|nr:MAG: 50S ribosomal protein L19 [uncultured bacterium]HCU70800.1 50S ribosomal protein L19 [Candidatus Moranbacteria bacterium]